MHFRNLIASIPEDKWLHLIYSAAIFSVFSTLFTTVTAIAISFLIGLLKEIWDWRYGTGFCLYDVLANIVGITSAYYLMVFITLLSQKSL